MTEHWRPIPDYEDYYEVSNLGRVRSLPRTLVRRNGLRYRVKGRILRPSRHKGSWVCSVTLARPGDHQQRCIHLLVAQAFGDMENAA